MKSVAVLCAAAESALGSGAAAYDVGEVGETPKTAIRDDAALRAAGLAKPRAGRVTALRDAPADRDPAGVLVERAARSLIEQLDVLSPSWRHRRIGVVVGTSSGGMIPLTRAFSLHARGEAVPRELARACPYFGPLEGLEALGVTPEVEVQVLAACASSAVAIGLGCRWLALGRADLVVAGGYDAVGQLVAAGFEALGATTAGVPAPFRQARDGMALGEGVALLALVAPDGVSKYLGYVRGFGMTSDANHVTAPDPEGGGLVRAARAALDDANLEPAAVDLVSAHATATPLNDSAEARSLATLFGERVPPVVVHPFKAVIGHTLGASGALESLAALGSMNRGIVPASIGAGALDPAFPASLLSSNAQGSLGTCLKLSAAFGGSNAALVLSTQPGPGRSLPRRHVTLVAVGDPCTAADLAAVADETQLPKTVASRLDPFSAAAVAAAATALSRAPALSRERMGVVVGTASASIAADEVFDRKLRERGPRVVDPRRFPPTSPNLPAGYCTIAFGLHGPSLAVGAGHDADIEALLVAVDLIAADDADSMVVVAAEQGGPVVEALWEAMGVPTPPDGAVAVILGRSVLDDARLLGAAMRARRARSNAPRASPVRRGWPAFLEALDLPAPGERA